VKQNSKDKKWKTKMEHKEQNTKSHKSASNNRPHLTITARTLTTKMSSL